MSSSHRHSHDYLHSIITSIEKRLHECIQNQADLRFEVYVNRPIALTFQQRDETPSSQASLPLASSESNKRKRDIYESGHTAAQPAQIPDDRIADLRQQLHQNMSALKERVDAQSTQFKNHLKSLDEYKSSLGEQFISHEAHSMLCDELYYKVGQVSERLVVLNDLMEEFHRQGMEDNRINSAQLTRLVEKQQTILDSRSDEKSRIEQLKSMQDSLTNHVKLHQEHQTHFQMLTTQLDAFASELKQQQEQLKQDREDASKQPHAQLSNHTSQLEEFEKQITERFTQFQSQFSGSLSEVKESLTQQFSKTLEERLQSLEEQWNKHLENTTLANSKEFDRWTTNMDSKLETHKQKFQSSLDALNVDQQNKRQILSEKLTEQTSEGLRDVESKMQDVVEENKKYIEQFKSFDERLTANNAEVKNVQTSLSGLESELCNYKADSDEKINTLDMSQSFKSLELQFTTLSNKFEEKIVQLKNSQSNMQGTINILTKENGRLKASLEALEANVAATSQKISQNIVSQESGRPSKKRKLLQNGSSTDEANGEAHEEAPLQTKTPTKKRKTKEIKKVESSTKPSASDEVEEFRIIFSGFKDDTPYDIRLKNHLEGVVAQLGGIVTEEDFPDKTTHVVSPPQLRTLKTLGACVSGTYICAPQWLQECEKKGKFVSCVDNPHCQLHERRLVGKVLGYSEKFQGLVDRKDHSSMLIRWGGGSISDDLSECDIILITKACDKEKLRSVNPKATFFKWEAFMDQLLPSEKSSTTKSMRTKTKKRRSSKGK